MQLGALLFSSEIFKRHRSIDPAASKNGVLLTDDSLSVSRTITGLGLKNRFLPDFKPKLRRLNQNLRILK
jgi:hypothetical protein